MGPKSFGYKNSKIVDSLAKETIEDGIETHDCYQKISNKIIF